jgi:hypothetical protein
MELTVALAVCTLLVATLQLALSVLDFTNGRRRPL